MAEAAEKEIDTGGAKQTFKELFAGAAGGVAQVLIGELILCLMFGEWAALKHFCSEF